VSDGDEMTPGNPAFERALAQGQFEFAKTRYARTITGQSVKNVIEFANKERARLTEEIKQLQVVSRARWEVAVEASQRYAMVLPHRVGKTWLQPPTTLEKVGEFFGSVRLYKAAAKAAKEFKEAQDLLAKRQLTLVNLERALRDRLDSQEAVVQDNLRTSDGLAYAMRRDPLLDLAYKHMRDVANSADGEPDAFVPHSPDDLPPMRSVGEGGEPASQYPDEPR
jgi:hypothetical protein